MTNLDDIQEEAVNHFKAFLNAPTSGLLIDENKLAELICFRVSNAEGDDLVRSVTEEEIKHTLLSMPSNKTPGPDGYTAEFFRAAWPIVGRDLVTAVQSFFMFGFMPHSVNSTVLALAPKKDDANAIKDFRPIACFNLIYKLISKILANRLKKILPESMAPNQSAFIEDKLLLENVLLATELVKDYHKTSVSSRCAIN